MDAIRLALNQNHPQGNERFYARIEKMTGVRRAAKPRGRPRLEDDVGATSSEGWGELAL